MERASERKKASQREKGHPGKNSDSSETENTSGSVNTSNLVRAREHDSCTRLPDFASFSLLYLNPLHHLPKGATVRGPIQAAALSPFPQSPQLSSSLFRKQSAVKWEALLISAPRPGAPFAWQSAGRGLWADDGRMRWEEWNRWVAAVVGGGEEDKRAKEGGIVELSVATVRFLLSISLLHNPFSQCSLCSSGPAALTRPNPSVTYPHRYHSLTTNDTHMHTRG